MDDTDMTEEDIRAFIGRDQQGGSSPGQHCNLCPHADTESCVHSCAVMRAETEREDGIKVSYS